MRLRLAGRILVQQFCQDISLRNVLAIRRDEQSPPLAGRDLLYLYSCYHTARPAIFLPQAKAQIFLFGPEKTLDPRVAEATFPEYQSSAVTRFLKGQRRTNLGGSHSLPQATIYTTNAEHAEIICRQQVR